MSLDTVWGYKFTVEIWVYFKYLLIQILKRTFFSHTMSIDGNVKIFVLFTIFLLFFLRLLDQFSVNVESDNYIIRLPQQKLEY